MKIAIYLRKSRADEEVEKRLGEGETLQKHRKILLKFAKEINYDILKIYEEIVSGESLIHRPEMLELLKEVGDKVYDAVLVMDIDRLGRGNMQEQGLILETFKATSTKIVTPRKTYDLSNDFDEEYSEFEAFMSRKELKVINRRLQRGRIQSVEEGNYTGTIPPFGYLKKDSSLIPHPEQADVVKTIFEMYTAQTIGTGFIAKELNSMGIKTYTGRKWTHNAVTNIINNPVYTGKICWQKKKSEKSKVAGKKRTVENQKKEDWIIVQGKHEALVSEEVFDKAHTIKSTRMISPSNAKRPMVNPLSGILYCGKCGFVMKRRPYNKQMPHILCSNVFCDSKSARFAYVEERLLQELQNLLIKYEADKGAAAKVNNSTDFYMKNLRSLQAELESLKTQKLKLHDLLEQGVYDINTFLERSQNISDRTDAIQESISLLEQKMFMESKQKDTTTQVAHLRRVIEIYPTLTDAVEKNILLKSILVKAEYRKEKTQLKNNFDLAIFPKVL
jgi:DNA invertase Pin-like site-specific DNA recombinase